MKKAPLFVISGNSGIPYKISASGNKYLLIAKALRREGYKNIIFNQYNIFENLEQSRGKIDGISYEFLSGKKKLVSYLEKIIGAIRSNIYLLFRLKELSNCYQNKKYIMISYCSIFMVLYFRILSNLFGFKLLINVWEYHPSTAQNFLDKINAYLFYKFVFKFSDGGIPISHFLEDVIKKSNKNLPIFRIPALADFKCSNNPVSDYNEETKYFLYCGSIGYREVIKFILDSFSQVEGEGVKLKLVISGKTKQVNKFAEEVSSYRKVKVYHDLPYSELFKLYANAVGLLIPMRPSLKDKARFPQKIPEYLSSGTPIITNPFGEIRFFFTDKENAIFANDFTTEAYEKAMLYVLENPKDSKFVGYRGKEFGAKEFHYESISKNFSEFLNLL